MNVSVLRFQGYIENMSVNILTQNIDGPKMNKNLQNVKKKKKLLKIKLEV